jgi:hypothetical protein
MIAMARSLPVAYAAVARRREEIAKLVGASKFAPSSISMAAT